ncbi:hypothetical protein D3C83_225840 [compost metagenome]
MKATSLPLLETSYSSALFTLIVRSGLYRPSVLIRMTTFLGSPPSVMVYSSPR